MAALSAALLMGGLTYIQTEKARKEASQQRTDANVQQARLEQEAKDRLAKDEANKAREISQRRTSYGKTGGMRSTILTSPLGLSGEAGGQKKTLLGA